MKIAVLGTQFNVMGYNGITKTTLTQGAVKIQLPGNRDWQLAPGQQAIVQANSDVQVIRADVEKALAWKNGLFYFRDDAMADMIGQIARWYDVEVTVKGAMPTRLFSGTVRRQASLAQVLDMLHYVSGATCSVEGRTVTVQF
jgi:ferric-dicitrate binding protein FerR (iron transport regulator)